MLKRLKVQIMQVIFPLPRKNKFGILSNSTHLYIMQSSKIVEVRFFLFFLKSLFLLHNNAFPIPTHSFILFLLGSGAGGGLPHQHGNRNFGIGIQHQQSQGINGGGSVGAVNVTTGSGSGRKKLGPYLYDPKSSKAGSILAQQRRSEQKGSAGNSYSKASFSRVVAGSSAGKYDGPLN